MSITEEVLSALCLGLWLYNLYAICRLLDCII